MKQCINQFYKQVLQSFKLIPNVHVCAHVEYMYMHIYPTEDHAVYMYKSWYLVSHPLSDQLLSLPQSQPLSDQLLFLPQSHPLSDQLLSLPQSQPPLYRRKQNHNTVSYDMKFELHVHV